MNCVMCGVDVDNQKKYKIFGNKYVCKNCYDHNEFYACGKCDCETPRQWWEEIYDGDTDEYICVCPFCYFEHNDKFPHDYKPAPIFHSLFNADRKHCLHVGVELEMEGNVNSFVNKMYHEFTDEHFYPKYDGSLDDDYGVEIVSNPMTITIAINKWRNLFKIINEYLESNSNCGLHFHLDREYLNDRQLRNIDYIINNFTESVKKLGGRDIIRNDWSYRENKNPDEWGTLTTDDRYHAVNFLNKNTVELRCFNSTDDWFNFRYILIAVYALVEYARIHKFDYFENMNDEEFWIAFNKFIQRYITKNNITE